MTLVTTLATYDDAVFAKQQATPARDGFFKRALDRIIAARMLQAERDIARFGYLRRQGSADLSDALAPLPSLPIRG